MSKNKAAVSHSSLATDWTKCLDSWGSRHKKAQAICFFSLGFGELGLVIVFHPSVSSFWQLWDEGREREVVEEREKRSVCVE